MDTETQANPQTGTQVVPLQIHQSLVAVAAELAKMGISKDRKNEQQGFRFRGIDDVMNAVGPLLAKHEVVFLPTYSDYQATERVTGKGGTLIYVRVVGTFTFVSAKDSSYVVVRTYGEAMDTGDKACNKAMSAALKYALLQTFNVPTESTEDADFTTQEPSVPKPPDGFEEWFKAIKAEGEQGFKAIRDAWHESPEAYRTYAMDFRRPEWEAAKAQATEVTTKLRDEAAARERDDAKSLDVPEKPARGERARAR